MTDATATTERLVRVYPLFERFWHWAQTLLILVLILTGFGLRGLHGELRFGQALTIHLMAAGLLVLLWIFAIFWHLTTGQWKHYVPSAQGLGQVIRFYAFGILQGERHPYRKAYWRKHNPLQALVYLSLKLLVFPLIWATGIALATYALWESSPSAQAVLPLIGEAHALMAFVLVAFTIVHVYMLTVGHSFLAHMKPMITGYDRITLTPAEAAYLADDEPGRLGA